MSASEERKKKHGDPEYNTTQKVKDRKKREEELKNKWFEHEATMHRLCLSAVSAQKVFTRAFRQHVAIVEDHPLEHMNRSTRTKKEPHPVESAGPFTAVADSSPTLPREDN